MRRHSKKKNLALALLFVICALYFIYYSDEELEQLPLETNWDTRRLVNKKIWLEAGDYLPLNVTYELLAGAQSPWQRFLCIGISSVKRNKVAYLIPTLKSIFTQSSANERSSMVVVVLLADFDATWRNDTVMEIQRNFPVELEEGQLVVIHAPQMWYPPLSGIKRNYDDPPERVSFRSKQNVDYSFLIHYSAGLGEYYLQLEDDITSAKHFLTTIRDKVEEQNMKLKNWAMLEFSSLGYIGKLYKSVDLPQLSRFLFLFYQEMPCDWLMTHFRLVMSQKDTIILKPSLFQHIGTFSSFKGIHNKLRDNDFEDEPYTNPPADVFSNISTYMKNLPLLAWTYGKGYFWGYSPQEGQHFTVVLHKPAVVTDILVETGSEGRDLLQSAQMELGNDVVTSSDMKSCKTFQSVGEFKHGRFEAHELDKKVPSSCLRILVTASQTEWVIIQKIRIKTSLNK